MKSNKHFVYQLVLLTSTLFPAEKVRDIAEDYEEYLREQPEKPEPPLQFCTAIMREERRYHPKAKTILSILAAALLIFVGIRANLFVGIRGKGFVPLSFLAVGLPIAIWTAINGSTAARYSPPFPHAARCVLLPFLAVALLSAGFLLVIYTALSRPFSMTPGMAWVFIKGRSVCSAAFLIFFFVSVCLLWRSSIWYFCSMVQSLSGWCSLKSIYYIMTRMDVSVSPPRAPYANCLIPLVLGLGLSLAFALRLRSITGKENV